jgi:glycosyltransferase involved in cell wall biosynthesis
MRVCIVTTAFPRWEGDSRGHFIWQQARSMAQQGVVVRVVCCHAPGARVREVMEGVEVSRVRYLWPERLEVLQNEGGGLPAVWRKGWLARLAFVPFFCALVWGVARHAGRSDVIHAHWTLAGMAAWLGCILQRRPLALTLHGSDIFMAPRIPGVAWLTRAILLRSQQVITNSRALAEAGMALGAPPERLEIIPIGINVEAFRPGTEPREPLLLFVGSLIERKGVRVLLEAAAQVFQQLPTYRLAIVGEGPLRAAVEQQAQASGIASQVEFVGPQTQAEVSGWMRRARLFVLPSLEEAFGVVLLEAMASGTPCVATQVGGIPELVMPGTGILVPPGDAPALAAAMVQALEDFEAWEAMSRRARQHVLEDCMTWDRMASRTVAIYARLSGSHA